MLNYVAQRLAESALVLLIMSFVVYGLIGGILGALLYLFGSALQVVLYFDLRLRQSEAALSSAAASSTARTILS